jgi:hypothetical protein
MTASNQHQETLLEDAELETVQGGAAVSIPIDWDDLIWLIQDPPLFPQPKPKPLGWEPTPRLPELPRLPPF